MGREISRDLLSNKQPGWKNLKRRKCLFWITVRDLVSISHCVIFSFPNRLECLCRAFVTLFCTARPDWFQLTANRMSNILSRKPYALSQALKFLHCIYFILLYSWCSLLLGKVVKDLCHKKKQKPINAKRRLVASALHQRRNAFPLRWLSSLDSVSNGLF